MREMIDDKLLKFIIVGTINTIVGTIIMFGMYNFFGFSYWISSSSNYILVSILSYALNKKYTFRHRGQTLKSSLKFAINIAICYIVAYGIAKPLIILIMNDSNIFLQENVAMLTGMILFTALNYLGQRLFVFKESVMEHINNYREWLESPSISDEERKNLEAMRDEEVLEAFYKYAEFGTAGMRGIMGLGTNRLNKYTIRMAAKGLAMLLGEGSRVVIAYDTRRNSLSFAEETAKVLAASGIDVLLFDRYSPVPLLSYAVRTLNCDGGVVITASHNTSQYNGFKVYDNTGCQMNEEMAGKIAANIEALEDRLSIKTSELDDEKIKYIGHEIIDDFMDAVASCDRGINRDDCRNLKIVYTSLHGSGREYVLETLKTAGFTDINLVAEQAEYDGDFPTVKKPNPEEKEAFEIASRQALQMGADIIIGTDPDCDRIGVAVPDGDEVFYLSGNQTGVLMIDFLARTGNPSGKTLVTTIVTSSMGPALAKSYGINVVETFTGFKNIGAEINKLNEDEFLMGYEESYGYLPGNHGRDKDGVSSALIVCQMAAYWKAQGRTLKEAMQLLYDTHGYWVDQQKSYVFEGAAGAQKISDIMVYFRNNGKDVFEGIAEIDSILDFKAGVDGFLPANVLKYMFKDGSWLAVRPSGTEPKIKFYYCITAKLKNDASKKFQELSQKIDEIIEG